MRTFFLVAFLVTHTVLNAQQVILLSPPPCYYQVATTFFPYPLVAQALSAHRFTQDRWLIIYQDLQLRSAYIPNILQDRASLMVPNPLQLFQPEAAQALLRAVLEETFEQSLLANYSTDIYINRMMFRFIRESQAERLRACFGAGPLIDSPITE